MSALLPGRPDADAAGPPPWPVRVVPLEDTDRGDLVELVQRDPVLHAVMAARLEAVPSLDPRRFGGTLLGARDAEGRLVAAVFHGGNLLPVGEGPAARAAWPALAAALSEQRRRCTSVVGDRDAVSALWDGLEAAWGPARTQRREQPLLSLGTARGLPVAHPDVRRIHPGELDRYEPAAAAMFTEELDVSPYVVSSPAEYRRRLAALARDGRCFAVVENDEVVFKADIGALTRDTCQLQGVWTRPDRRGRGLATAALAGVLRVGLQLAPTVSLYVNDFNTAGRRLYARLGMRQVGTLRTVLF